MVTGDAIRLAKAEADGGARRPGEPEEEGEGGGHGEDRGDDLELVEASGSQGEVGDGRKMSSTAADQRRESTDFSGLTASRHERLEEDGEGRTAVLLSCSSG